MQKFKVFLSGLLDFFIGLFFWIAGAFKVGGRLLLKLIVALALVVTMLSVCMIFNILGIRSGCVEGLRQGVIPPIGREEESINACMNNAVERNLDIVQQVVKGYRRQPTQ